MAEFRMPSLGADMEAGTLVEWKKRPGDRVARGDIIAEVETDKGIIEVDVLTPGVVEKLLVETGTKVPVGTPLATIREDGQPAGTAVASAAPATPAAPPAPAPAAAAPPPSTPVAERARVSPAARRRARELGVPPGSLVAAEPGGAVTLADVERIARERSGEERAAAGAPAGDARARMRKAIAAAMTRSKLTIPHYYVSHTVDLGPALGWLERHNETAPLTDRLIPTVLFLKAVAKALGEYRDFNGSWVDDRFVPSQDIHLGVAIALRGGGLVAPALPHTDRASLPELMQRLHDLVRRARAGALRSSEMSDGTLTVTSLGDRGAESVLGIIYPPQVALVGFGRVVERPWVVGGAVVARPVVRVSLAADHRVTDGHAGALFLAAIAEHLTDPSPL